MRSVGNSIPPRGARLLLEVAQRVVGERLERLGDAALLVGERLLERAASSTTPSATSVPFRQTLPPSTRTSSPSESSSKSGAPGASTSRTPARTSSSGPGFGKPPGRRGRDVDDGPDAGLRELLGRHAVEVGVVDDRDVLGAEPLDEVLRPPPEPRAGPLISAFTAALVRR